MRVLFVASDRGLSYSQFKQVVDLVTSYCSSSLVSSFDYDARLINIAHYCGKSFSKCDEKDGTFLDELKETLLHWNPNYFVDEVNRQVSNFEFSCEQFEQGNHCLSFIYAPKDTIEQFYRTWNQLEVMDLSILGTIDSSQNIIDYIINS